MDKTEVETKAVETIEIADLSDLAKGPELKELIIDDDAIVKKYGMGFRFYMLDNLEIEQYFTLAEVSEDVVAISKAISPLLLDKKGNQVEVNGKTIPPMVKMAVLRKMMENVGKLMAR